MSVAVIVEISENECAVLMKSIPKNEDDWDSFH